MQDSSRRAIMIRNSTVGYKGIYMVEKQSKCDGCIYGCDKTGCLRRHPSPHVDEHPYQCDYCGFECFAKEDLIIHIKAHLF